MSVLRDWADIRLTYLNLKRNSTKNKITAEELENIWKPWTVFDNTEHIESIVTTDEPDTLTIIPNPELRFERADKTHFQNTRLFKGMENVISFWRQKTVNWVCVYNMRWYPFDVQLCELRLIQSEAEVTLIPTLVTYSGPRDLPQHFVKDVTMCPIIFKGRHGIIVEVTLGRPLFGTLLSVFMPTSILLVLSQVVTVFGKHYIEMVIEVNLTLLLVLATL